MIRLELWASGKNSAEVKLPSHHIIIKGMWYQRASLLVMFTLITWWRWGLLGFSTTQLLFPCFPYSRLACESLSPGQAQGGPGGRRSGQIPGKDSVYSYYLEFFYKDLSFFFLMYLLLCLIIHLYQCNLMCTLDCKPTLCYLFQGHIYTSLICPILLFFWAFSLFWHLKVIQAFLAISCLSA